MTGSFKEKLEDELSLLIAESGLNGIDSNDFIKLCTDIFKTMNGLKAAGGEI